MSRRRKIVLPSPYDLGNPWRSRPSFSHSPKCPFVTVISADHKTTSS